MSAALGKTVYGGGSYAPSKGQVSAKGAQGYIQRELAKKQKAGSVSKVGRDGQSNTRSGIAAKAVKTNIGKSTGSAGMGSIQNGWTKWSSLGNKPTDTTTTPTPSTPTPTPGTPATGGPAAPATPEPTTPQVVVNATGQLELPYDQQFSSEVLDALSQYNEDLLGLQMDTQTEAANYLKTRRDTDSAYSELGRSTLNDNAARGTAYSSGYGVAVGKNAQAYQNQLNDADQTHTSFGQNNELKRSGIIAAFQRLLSQSALDYGNDLSEDAGDLGFDDEPEATDEGTPMAPVTNATSADMGTVQTGWQNYYGNPPTPPKSTVKPYVVKPKPKPKPKPKKPKKKK